MWQKAVRGSKFGFATIWGSADASDQPSSKTENKVGAETFWPSTIDKESYKAARILRSFCKDGVYEETSHHSHDTQSHQRVIKKIPLTIIRNAKGLAIFTTMRAGLWYSGAGGSGILVARMADGTWSPPSGILLHTTPAGLLVGSDICDCILVLNTQEAVDAFSQWRSTLGGAMTAVAGPLRIMGLADTDPYKDPAPVLSYLRARGFHAGAQIDGTVFVERGEENQKYYGYKYSASEIVSGKVRNPPTELRTLWHTLKAAQGDPDADHSALPTEPSPADLEVVHSDYVFGVPDKEDPDPFGVLALEKEGLQIREAGTKTAVPNEVFEFRPNATSPIFDTYNTRTFEKDKPDSRRSSWRDMQDSKRSSYIDQQDSRRSSWRNSALTLSNPDRFKSVTSDTSAQTGPGDPLTPGITDCAMTLKMDRSNLPSTPSGLPGTPPSVPQTPPQVPLKSPDDTVASSTRTSPHPPQRAFSGAKAKITDMHATAATAAAPATRGKTNGTVPPYESSKSVTVREDSKVFVNDRPAASQTDSVAKSLGVEDDEDDDLDDDDEEEEPVIIEEVHQASRPQAVFKPRVVTIPRHLRPEVPQRNPSRTQLPSSMQSLPGEDTPSIDQASMISVRSSSTSGEGHHRKDSLISLGSPPPPQRSPSLHSVNLDDKTVTTAPASPPSTINANSSSTVPRRRSSKPDEAPTVAGTSEVQAINTTTSRDTSISSSVKPPRTSTGSSALASSSLSSSKGKPASASTTAAAVPDKKAATTSNNPTVSQSTTKTPASISNDGTTSLPVKRASTMTSSVNNTTAPLSPKNSSAANATHTSAPLSSLKTSTPLPVLSQGPPSLTSRMARSATIPNNPAAPLPSAAKNAARPTSLTAASISPAAASTPSSSKALAPANSKPVAITSQVKRTSLSSANVTTAPSSALKDRPHSSGTSATSKPSTSAPQKENIALVNDNTKAPPSPKADGEPALIAASTIASAAALVDNSASTTTATTTSPPISASAPSSTTVVTGTSAPMPMPTPTRTPDDMHIDVPPPPSPSDTKSNAPRISLMSMKFSLDDDDKSDNDDDEVASTSPPPKSTLRLSADLRLGSLDYGYGTGK